MVLAGSRFHWKQFCPKMNSWVMGQFSVTQVIEMPIYQYDVIIKINFAFFWRNHFRLNYCTEDLDSGAF